MSFYGGWLLAFDAAHALAEAARVAETTRSLSRVPELAALSTRVMTTEGAMATIAVHGVLTKHPDPWVARVAGRNTAYSDLLSALESVDADDAITAVMLDVDSPGGQAAGLFELLTKLESVRSRKAMQVRASDARSAAYAIAAAAGPIEATNVAATFGAVGVAATIAVVPSIVTVTSSDAPDKRPDVRTEEGRRAVRRELDALHDLLVSAIANGRRTDAETVNRTFGRGATVLAKQARDSGMIDAIRGHASGTVSAYGGAGARDLGDEIVALMEAQRGGASARPTKSQSAGEPQDIGDEIVAVLERQRSGLPALPPSKAVNNEGLRRAGVTESAEDEAFAKLCERVAQWTGVSR